VGAAKIPIGHDDAVARRCGEPREPDREHLPHVCSSPGRSSLLPAVDP
jgi:hypothetical protein